MKTGLLIILTSIALFITPCGVTSAQPPNTHLILYYEYIQKNNMIYPVISIYQKTNGVYEICQHYKFVIYFGSVVFQSILEERVNKLTSCFLGSNYENENRKTIFEFQTLLMRSGIDDIHTDGFWGPGTWKGFFQFLKKYHDNTFSFKEKTFLVIDLNKIKDRLNASYFNDVDNDNADDSLLKITDEVRRVIGEPVAYSSVSSENEETALEKKINNKNDEFKNDLSGNLEKIQEGLEELISKMNTLDEKIRRVERAPLTEDELKEIAALLRKDMPTNIKAESIIEREKYDLIPGMQPRYQAFAVISAIIIIISTLLMVFHIFVTRRVQTIINEKYKDDKTSLLNEILGKLPALSQAVETLLEEMKNKSPDDLKTYLSSEIKSLLTKVEKHNKTLADSVTSIIHVKLAEYCAIDDKPAQPYIISKLNELLLLKAYVKEIADSSSAPQISKDQKKIHKVD